MQDNEIKELYNNIKSNTGKYEKYRKNNIVKKFFIFVIISFILYLIIGPPLINEDNMYNIYIMAGIIVVSLIVLVIHRLSFRTKTVSSITNKEKTSIIIEYINNVLSPIIKEVFKDSQYIPNEGLDHEIYVDGFEDRINKYMIVGTHSGIYNSKNKIITKLNNKLELVIAEIESINFDKDDTGKELFGMAGYIKLPKKYDVSIRLKKHINYLLGQKTLVIPAWGADVSQIKFVEKDYFKTNIEILDKLYDIEVDSKEKASEILNNSFLIELSKIVEKYSVEFRFSVRNDMLYVWYGIENKIFKPNIKITEKEIERIYMQFMNIKNISEEISNLILSN